MVLLDPKLRNFWEYKFCSKGLKPLHEKIAKEIQLHNYTYFEPQTVSNFPEPGQGRR